MAARLIDRKHQVFVWNQSAKRMAPLVPMIEPVLEACGKMVESGWGERDAAAISAFSSAHGRKSITQSGQR